MNITQQAQKAYCAFLKTLTLDSVPSSQIYRGIENSTKSESEDEPERRLLPCVIVECKRASESLQDSGNWTASVRIMCRSNADDTTEDEHHEFASEIFSNVFYADSKTDLNSQDDFTVLQVRAQEQGYDLEDRSWVSYMEMAVECCASDLTP
jgi:hypothetical protein